jgi:hypothetical protein
MPWLHAFRETALQSLSKETLFGEAHTFRNNLQAQRMRINLKSDLTKNFVLLFQKN